MSVLLLVASDAVPNDGRIAVIIQQHDATEEVTSAISRSVLIALENYVYYYLHRLGYDPFILRPAETPSQTELARLMADSACTRLYHIRAQASFENRQVQIRDHHRIERHTLIGGFLEVGVAVTEFEMFSGKLAEGAGRSIAETALPNWKSNQGSTVEINYHARLPYSPEPNEFVLERVVSKIFERLEPGLDEPAGTAGEVIPVRVIFDTSYTRLTTSSYEPEAELIVRSASRITRRELGIRLHYVGARVSPFGNPESSVEDQIRPQGDTVAVYVHTQPGSRDYQTGVSGDVIGLGALGMQSLYIRQFDPSRKVGEEWRSFFTVIALVHELGHSLGAIHVSDPWSIMSHEATWIGSSRFDSFNRAVVKQVARNRSDTVDMAGYAEILARQLSETSYDLIDYPPALQAAFDKIGSVGGQKRKGQQPAYLEYSRSAQAYRDLLRGNRADAAIGFREAIKHEGGRPVLYFYLSLCTDGQEARDALLKAAAKSYWLAQRRAALFKR